jgi:putative aminopeptidase FrvX
MNEKYQGWLKELTSIPTAAGRETRVLNWIRAFAAKWPELSVAYDEAGNVSVWRKSHETATPLIIEAHMDHPAFVCIETPLEKSLVAEFRGGVQDAFFTGTKVMLWHGDSPGVTGTVGGVVKATPRESFGTTSWDKCWEITFEEPVKASPGDVITWKLPDAYVEEGLLRAPACDDLAGLAAAVSAYDRLMELAGQGASVGDVRLFFSRAEEVAFIGVIAACRLGTLPKGARILALENSKSFPESPIGGGPIVRVGDLTSTFDPDLTYRIGRVALALGSEDPGFKHQRKLMVGGTCEASAFQAYGHIAACVCLALGNYHNMNDATGKIDSEVISMSDYDGLVKLLVEVALRIDKPGAAPSLKDRLEKMFETRKRFLEPMG